MVPSSLDSYSRAVAADVFAGVAVTDYSTALAWYERLLGKAAFFPTETEAVWQLTDHGWLFIVQRPEHAGHAIPTVFVENLDGLVAQIAARGIEAARTERYASGARKVIYCDPDGNEIGFGGSSE